MIQFRWRFVYFTLFFLLTACVMPAPAPTPEPAPEPPKPVPVVVPAPSEDSLPSNHAVLNLPKTPPATSKPAPVATQSAPGAKNGKALDAKLPSQEPPVVAASAPAAKAKPATSKAMSALLNEFPWLQSCQKRSEFGGAVQCDVDTLLAQPSARVQVYVREPKLARTMPDGLRIQLREGLPRLYRFFVVP